MGSPVKSIERQIVAKLKANATLLSLIPGGIHSKILEKPLYPYVRIGDALEGRFNTFDRVGKDTNIKLYIFSTKPTDEEVYDVYDAIDEVLDDCSLTLSGWTSVLCAFDSFQIIPETDNRSRYGVLTYNVISQKG